jgi:hypothetical protein
MATLLRILINSNLRALAAKYGWSVARQLVKVGINYTREKNAHHEWTEADRHLYLANQLKGVDVLPETKVDDDAIAIVVDYFLGPKEAATKS